MKVSDYIIEFLENCGVKHVFMLPGGMAMHINDSKNPISSHKDRHELIGKGYIGLDNFVKIINNERIKGIPMCLETPVDNEDHYKEEIDMLRSYYKK